MIGRFFWANRSGLSRTSNKRSTSNASTNGSIITSRDSPKDGRSFPDASPMMMAVGRRRNNGGVNLFTLQKRRVQERNQQA